MNYEMDAMAKTRLNHVEGCCICVLRLHSISFHLFASFEPWIIRQLITMLIRHCLINSQTQRERETSLSTFFNDSFRLRMQKSTKQS